MRGHVQLRNGFYPARPPMLMDAPITKLYRYFLSPQSID
jgi:hypothetical protein